MKLNATVLTGYGAAARCGCTGGAGAHLGMKGRWRRELRGLRDEPRGGPSGAAQRV